jgi:hypothetical protein
MKMSWMNLILMIGKATSRKEDMGTPWAQIKHKSSDWDDYLNERMRREDAAVAAKFSAYKNLGRGHLLGHLVKGWRNEE